MNCPTCGKADFNPPWRIAQLAGFDPAADCALMANRFGKVQKCGPMIKLGRFDCSGGTCSVAAKYTKVIKDKFGREKEVFYDPDRAEVRTENLD